MTEQEIKDLITIFRTHVEDFISATRRRFYVNDGSVYPDDGRIEPDGEPWASVQEVLDTIPEGLRTAYLTVNIQGVEYWFLPDLVSLVPKIGDLAIADGSVTMVKLANVPSGTVFYRKTASDGPPEIQTLQTLKDDLGIPDISGLVAQVDGHSLVSNELILKIHDKFAPDEAAAIQAIWVFLNELVLTDNNYTDEEKAKLELLKQDVFTIYLPSYDNVSERCENAVETTDYPTGWILDEDVDDKDISITHNLNRRIANVNVFQVDNGEERFLRGNMAYSGYVAVSKNRLVINGLSTVGYPIVIQLIFA